MTSIRASRRNTPRGTGRFGVMAFLDNSNSLDFTVRTNIEWEIEEKINTAPNQTEIDLWLFGPGGTCHEAFRLWCALRERCCYLRSIVISHAQSALTMLAIGSDELWMAASAALSPIDGQVTCSMRSDQVSCIDYSHALELGRAEAAEYLRNMIAVFPENTLTTKQLLDLSAALFGQILENTDLPQTSSLQRSLDIPVRYLKEMLAARVCPKRRSFSAAKVTKHLIHKYSSHGDVISRDHARKLGFPVYDLKSYPYIDALQQEFREWLEEEEPGTPMIDVVRLET